MDNRPWLVSVVHEALQNAPEEVAFSKDDLIDWVVNALLDYVDVDVDTEGPDEWSGSEETWEPPTKKGRFEGSFAPGGATSGQPPRMDK